MKQSVTVGAQLLWGGRFGCNNGRYGCTIVMSCIEINKAVSQWLLTFNLCVSVTWPLTCAFHIPCTHTPEIIDMHRGVCDNYNTCIDFKAMVEPQKRKQKICKHLIGHTVWSCATCVTYMLIVVSGINNASRAWSCRLDCRQLLLTFQFVILVQKGIALLFGKGGATPSLSKDIGMILSNTCAVHETSSDNEHFRYKPNRDTGNC